MLVKVSGLITDTTSPEYVLTGVGAINTVVLSLLA